MLDLSRTSVVDDRQTLFQHWPDVLCLLGCVTHIIRHGIRQVATRSLFSSLFDIAR